MDFDFELKANIWWNRGADDSNKTALAYKSGKRAELEGGGFRIHGSSGDQWSDLLGTPTATRSFKLPNPVYFVAWSKKLVSTHFIYPIKCQNLVWYFGFSYGLLFSGYYFFFFFFLECLAKHYFSWKMFSFNGFPGLSMHYVFIYIPSWISSLLNELLFKVASMFLSFLENHFRKWWKTGKKCGVKRDKERLNIGVGFKRTGPIQLDSTWVFPYQKWFTMWFLKLGPLHF